MPSNAAAGGPVRRRRSSAKTNLTTMRFRHVLLRTATGPDELQRLGKPGARAPFLPVRGTDGPDGGGSRFGDVLPLSGPGRDGGGRPEGRSIAGAGPSAAQGVGRCCGQSLISARDFAVRILSARRFYHGGRRRLRGVFGPREFRPLFASFLISGCQKLMAGREDSFKGQLAGPTRQR